MRLDSGHLFYYSTIIKQYWLLKSSFVEQKEESYAEVVHIY